jgi:flagellar FliJ protein
MKGIATLIKLHKRTLDDLRRQMVLLENQKEQLLLLSQKLKDDLQKEIVLASQNPEMGNFFSGFSKRMEHRQIEIAGEVRVLDTQMLKLNNEITDAFSDLKKFEIAQENDRIRVKEAAARRDTIAMDEIAEQQHRRKQQEET